MSIQVVNFDPSILLGYYQSKLSSTAANTTSPSASSTAKSSSASSTSSSSASTTPWSSTNSKPSQQVEDANVLSLDKFIDPTKYLPLTGSSSNRNTDQDNQKLFAIYNAVNNLSYLASMSKRDGTTAGQMAGYNDRFQQGLQQVLSYIGSAKFNNFSLQASAPSLTVTGKAAVPSSVFGYTGHTVVSHDNLDAAVSGLSSSDKFSIAVSSGNTTTNLDVDLSQIDGPITLDSVVALANKKLADAGFASRFQRTMTAGDITDLKKTSYGIKINASAGESLSLSSPNSTPSLYMSETSGTLVAKGKTAADNQGGLYKISDLSDPNVDFLRNVAPTKGTTTAAATVVDASGNVYTVGNATGDMGGELNQGTQDVYVSKYDSAGVLQWQHELGSAGTATGSSLALNPNGGVVVVGSTTADVMPNATADGNVDTFASSFDANGNQVWTTQLQTLNPNQATSVAVDAGGNVYVGGQISKGRVNNQQTASGAADAFVVKLDSKGKIAFETNGAGDNHYDVNQFGSTGNDSVSAMTMTSSGDLLVASTQDGHGVLSKYAGGDLNSAPVWTTDLGNLQDGGAITGLAVNGGKIYVSGNSSNGALADNVVHPSSGFGDAFVMSLTDSGTAAAKDYVSYVGTSGNEKAGAVTVGPEGSVYLAGSTDSTFAGQDRNIDKVSNAFVAAFGADGNVNWVQQFGGIDGQSSGKGIAIDPNGSSVLDKLGLPRGTVNTSTNPSLIGSTNLRPGDSFKIALQGDAARTFTVTVDSGETLRSLAAKINRSLGSKGKASVNYGSGGSSLKLVMNAGVTATLIAGPADSDALGRLGITPQTLTDGKSVTTKAATPSGTKVTQTFGLGLSSNMNISTASSAGAVMAQLKNVLSAIQKAYKATNTTTTSTASGSAASSSSSSSSAGTAAAQAQLNSYNSALAMLGGSTSVVG